MLPIACNGLCIDGQSSYRDAKRNARPAQSKHGQLNHRRLWAGGGTNLISRPLLRITIKWASDAIIQSRVDRGEEEGRAFTLKDNFRFNYIYFPSIADLEQRWDESGPFIIYSFQLQLTAHLVKNRWVTWSAIKSRNIQHFRGVM